MWHFISEHLLIIFFRLYYGIQFVISYESVCSFSSSVQCESLHFYVVRNNEHGIQSNIYYDRHGPLGSTYLHAFIACSINGV